MLMMRRTWATGWVVLAASFCFAACGGDSADNAVDAHDQAPYTLDVAHNDVIVDVPKDVVTSDPGKDSGLDVTGLDDTTGLQDNLDQDVSLDVSVTCPAVGAVIISEIMYNPKIPSDTDGEYFEVTNTTGAEIDLNAWSILSQDKIHTIAADAPLIVPAHGVMLFARSANVTENGGITPDYVYDKITLTNEADDISIKCGAIIIDAVSYDITAGWPKLDGRAMVLDPSGFDFEANDDPYHWCNGFATFGGGDFGSPGAVNTSCGLTSCGDKVTQSWEECDDGNTKLGDGCENDCTVSPEVTTDVIDATDDTMTD